MCRMPELKINREDEPVALRVLEPREAPGVGN
jgi:hypothetical protein